MGSILRDEIRSSLRGCIRESMRCQLLHFIYSKCILVLQRTCARFLLSSEFEIENNILVISDVFTNINFVSHIQGEEMKVVLSRKLAADGGFLVQAKTAINSGMCITYYKSTTSIVWSSTTFEKLGELNINFSLKYVAINDDVIVGAVEMEICTRSRTTRIIPY